MRLANWDIRLVEYIDRHRFIPFAWGTNDCLTFTNGAHEILTGRGFADAEAGQSCTSIAAKRQFLAHMRAVARGLAPDLLDTLLERREGTPWRGDIVARKNEDMCTGYALGILIGRKIAMVGRNGLMFDHRDAGDLYWAVE